MTNQVVTLVVRNDIVQRGNHIHLDDDSTRRITGMPWEEARDMLVSDGWQERAGRTVSLPNGSGLLYFKKSQTIE